MVLSLTHKVGHGVNIFFGEEIIAKLTLKYFEKNPYSVLFNFETFKGDYDIQTYMIRNKERVKPLPNLEVFINLFNPSYEGEKIKLCYDAPENLKILRFNLGKPEK